MRPDTATATDAYQNPTTLSYTASNWTYNSRLQVTQDGAGTTYTYSPTQNNGQVLTSTAVFHGATTYTYDALNRLSGASGSTWGTTYTYDGFGNLTDKNVTAGSAPPLHVTVNAKNQVNTTGYTYDLNGNLTALPGVGTPGYDVENRTSSMALSSGDTYTYSYGPDNRKVWTKLTPASSASSEGLTLYGASGELLVSFGLTATTHRMGTAYVYFAGRKIWSTSNAPVLPDRLGSTGTATNLLYPYGESTSGSGYSFATYEHSGASGLDYAHNRYYSSTLARFTTADPYRNSARAGAPSSWNRYPYVLGDPVNRTDPTGLDDYDDPEYRQDVGGDLPDAGLISSVTVTAYNPIDPKPIDMGSGLSDADIDEISYNSTQSSQQPQVQQVQGTRSQAQTKPHKEPCTVRETPARGPMSDLVKFVHNYEEGVEGPALMLAMPALIAGTGATLVGAVVVVTVEVCLTPGASFACAYTAVHATAVAASGVGLVYAGYKFFVNQTIPYFKNRGCVAP